MRKKGRFVSPPRSGLSLLIVTSPHGCDRKWRTVFAELCCSFGESVAGREEIPWRLLIADLRCSGLHQILGTDESGRQENRNGTGKAPVFLLSCFPDSLSGPCFHQRKRDSAPAALSATFDRTLGERAVDRGLRLDRIPP